MFLNIVQLSNCKDMMKRLVIFCIQNYIPRRTKIIKTKCLRGVGKMIKEKEQTSRASRMMMNRYSRSIG